MPASEAIPVAAVPLTAAEAEAMQQRRIKKHHVAVVLLHWFNAFVWGFELLTGLALVSSPLFRVAPAWYVSMVEGVFGSRANLLEFHVVLGVAWILVFLVYGTFGFRTYLGGEVLRNEIALDRDDFRWLVVRTLRMLGRSRDPLPPQGSYNAGQKLFAFVVYAMIPFVMATGLVMALRLFGPAAIGWAAVLHFGAVGVVVSGLMVHVYMGAVFPEEKPAFFSMITGTVDELYAYHHHFKWWRQVRLARREWAARIEGAAPTAVPEVNAADGSDPAA
jgi:formate dehydrogenase subunit gamma